MSVRLKESKNTSCVKKDYSWNNATFTYENDENLTSTTHNSVIMCDKIINTAETISTNMPTIL